MTDIFKTIEWTVNSLIGGVEDGTIQLPDLQRPFVWPAAKVRDLFDSMYRGYPVGELMFWDVPAEGETRAIAKNTQLGASHQIVDGQQRLTSLYAAIKGQPVRDENYRDRPIKIGFNPFTEKFEVFNKAIERSPQWVDDIATVFASPLKARKAFMRRYGDSGVELTDDEEERIEEVFIRLDSLRNYQFEIVHIQKEVTKATVADIFVRINSEGVSLKAYDYILTWLSVFWPDGREEIEEFARNSRVSPESASLIAGRKITWTAHNPFVSVETGHIVRAIVAVGQNRAKLSDAYAALQAKDRATGSVDPAKQSAELDKLKSALPIVTNPLHWQEFIHSIKIAGFTDRRGITSTTNLISTYILFLLGRTKFDVKLDRLRPLIARWLFMSQLSSRYTGSGETQLQKDLDRLAGIGVKDADGFVRALDEVIATELTADFWTYRIPDSLITSSQALSPSYQCYLAALNNLDAELFMIRMKVSQWMNPAMPAIKGMEAHHLFPRKYQETVLGTTDLKRINQAANFAPTDWDTNIFISDRPPAEYWDALVRQRAGGDHEWLDKQRYWHALPDRWEQLPYEEFLAERRKLIAGVVRDGFNKIGTGAVVPLSIPGEILEVEIGESAPLEEWTVAALIDAGVLRAGDNLDPVDGAPVDAAVTDDATLLLIDGEGRTEEFDSLDAAARHLGFDNIAGLDFWVLDDNPDMPLGELVSRSQEEAAS